MDSEKNFVQSLVSRVREWFKTKQRSEDEPTIRRIYRGEVPFLHDSDTDISKNIRKSRVQKKTKLSLGVAVPHFSLKKEAKRDGSESEEPRPKSVRRKSISPGTAKQIKSKESTPQTFPNNFIVTSRYTLWNFIPKNLFEQLRRVVNFYFLVIAFVQTVIDTPVHPITAISPLAFVIVVTALKQGYEDWLRHKSDDLVNNRIARLVKDGKVEDIKSKDIRVGDIIKLEAEEQVPCDLLLLGSSDEFARGQINTANLDGETNLKLRYCPSGLPSFKNLEDFDKLHCIIECENPCEDLYEFNGTLLIPADKHLKMQQARGSAGGQQAATEDTADLKGLLRQGVTDFLAIPLSMDNMVLRGTRLKNTEYIYGLVIYTGKDTRLARNSLATNAKFSTVDKAINYYLIFFIAMLAVIVTFCVIMHYALDNTLTEAWYLQDHEGPDGPYAATKVFNTIASFTILFNYIIPISLYVTIELQKFLGSKFFVWDQDMMDEDGNEPLCNTSDLNEELGLIEYLFSDKTGTLTQNVMKFHQCSIETVKYELKSEEQVLYQLGTSTTETKPINVFANSDVLRFFTTLALCHSVQVVPKRRPSFSSQARMVTPQPSAVKQGRGSVNNETEFQASSPDEKALLECCEMLGITFLGEKEDWMTLNINGEIEAYKRLMTLEFDADRKCMSVIVENSNKEIWLLTKGAESHIIPKCDYGPSQETLKHVMEYAMMGLRTLAVAIRQLTIEEFDLFNQEIRDARRLLKNRQQKVREVYMSIESHMTLIGATGVEDQLQENVPETLQSFAAAGIRVWMLTGDKLETGVNVAMSCGLITASTKQYVMSHCSDKEQITRNLTAIKNEMDTSDNNCFVIDGETLAWAFKECPDLLRDVSMSAYRVVCCRMAPLQKAQVVNMVKDSKTKPTCCAVGDGANDCAMILAAHVGIGILGKEGRQAARCADFALAKFGHLRKAILVHGHWYYVRLANLTNYFFYKNIIFILPQLFFSFNSYFSTQAIFNSMFLMCYNIFFSSCPIFYYGLTEQPYPADTLLRYPQLYKKNARNSLMTVRQFLPWFVFAIWHGIVCYYLPYFAWNNFDQMDDLESFGTVVATALVLVSNLKMLVETKLISWWYVGSQLYSYVTYFVISAFTSEITVSFLKSNEFRHVFFTMLSSLSFWLLMPLIGVVGVMPDITFAVFKKSWKKILRNFKTFGQDFKSGKWLTPRKKRRSFQYPPNLLFSKRTGSLAISNLTMTSYLSNSNPNV